VKPNDLDWTCHNVAPGIAPVATVPRGRKLTAERSAAADTAVTLWPDDPYCGDDLPVPACT
jgi:hypothetical protein